MKNILTKIIVSINFKDKTCIINLEQKNIAKTIFKDNETLFDLGHGEYYLENKINNVCLIDHLKDKILAIVYILGQDEKIIDLYVDKCKQKLLNHFDSIIENANNIKLLTQLANR